MKKVISFVLSMCMVVSMLPVSLGTAQVVTAQGVEEQAVTQQTVAAKTFATQNSDSVHNHNDGSWQAWTDSTKLPTSGKYYLTGAVQPTAMTTLTGALTLCLCGNTVTAPTSSQLIKVMQETSLSICDCSATYDAEGNLKAGKLFGNNTYGSIVMVSPNAVPSTNIQVKLDRVILDGNNNKAAHSSGYGGGAVWTGNPKFDITINDCVFQNCGSAYNGGAIDLKYGGNLTATNTVFRNNTAEDYGGAIYAPKSSTIALTGCSFINNSSADGGGAIEVEGGSLTATNVIFDQNKFTGAAAGSSYGGGAILARGGTPTIRLENCAFTKNTSTWQAGALHINGSNTVTLNKCSFSENQSAHYGGAIFQYNSGSMTVTECTFTSNKTTAKDGGAIFTSRALEVTGSTFTTNSSLTYGGAIYAGTNLTVSSTTFDGNTNSSRGGAVYIIGGTTHSITGSIFTNNVTTDDGGAIYHGAGTLTLTESNFTGNNARVGSAGEGGALYAIAGVTVNNCSFTGNNAALAGTIWTNASLSIGGNTKVCDNTSADAISANIYLSGSNQLTLNALGAQADVKVGTATTADANAFLVAGSNLANGILPVYYQNAEKQVAYKNGVFSLSEITHSNHHACTCAMGTTGCTHQEEVLEWQLWESGTQLPTTAGNYCLTQDITLAEATTISANVKICLNGFNINLNQNSINNSGQLTIMNCKATLNAKKQLVSENGKIYNGNRSSEGGAIKNTGTITLIGILLANNQASGADVRTGGALHMENGAATILSCKFTDNQARSNSATAANRGVGGAISMYYNACATITDTVFSNNTAQLWGGAISVCNKEANKDSYLTINGNTEFTGNQTPNTESGTGSALYLFDFNETKTLTVTIGGNTVISGNTAAVYGAVLLRSYYADSPLQVTIADNAKVYGNKAGTKAKADIYISDNNTKLTLDALAADAEVNVATNGDKEASAFLQAGSNLTSGTLPVYYQNTRKQVKYEEQLFSLVEFAHRDHFACACVIGATGCSHGAEEDLVWTPWTSTNSLPTKTGNYYLTEDVDLTKALGENDQNTQNVTRGNTVRLCLNGKNVVCDYNNALQYSYFAYEGNLTIMNCRAELDSNQKLDAAKSEGGKITGGSNTRAAMLRTYGNAQLTLIGIELSENEMHTTDANRNHGGALLVEGGTVAVQYCRFADNYSNQMGAAIQINGYYSEVQSVTVEHTVFTGNKAAREGGAIGIYSGKNNADGFAVTVRNSLFENNTGTDGGAIGIIRSSDTPTNVELNFVLEDCSFTGNAAKNYGGATIVIGQNETKTNLLLKSVQMSGNTAGYGGAISAQRAQVTVSGNTMVKQNAAKVNGGAAYMRFSSLTMTGGTFAENTALNGGGVYLHADVNEMQAALELQGGVISGNEASTGGGVYAFTDSVINMRSGSVEGNHATGGGGGIYLYTNAVGNFYGGTIQNNYSNDCGGGINASGAQVYLKGTTISGNVADHFGGGIRMYYDSYFEMESGIVDNNKAGRCGGGIALFCDATIKGGKITNNWLDPEMEITKSGFKGGGIYIYDEGGNVYNQRFYDLNITGGEISGNTSPEYGGGIYMNGRQIVTMTGGVIKDNEAGLQGGGIMVDNAVHMRSSKSILRIIDGEISGNKAQDGGGIYSHLCAYPDIQGGTFTGNVATNAGGAIHFGRGTNAQLRNATFTKNQAEKGAALYFMDDTVMENLTVTDNESGDGYAVYLERGDYDGESYVMGIIKMSGNMIVANNNGNKPNMFIGKGSQILVDNAGMGEQTEMHIALEEGVLTSTVIGPYNYQGGNQSYVLTAGNKSTTTIETNPLAGNSSSSSSSGHTNHQACTCAMGTEGCTHSGTISWGKWTQTNALPTSGNYYLSADITLSGNVAVSGTLNLCLNGHNINLNGYHITNTGNLVIMNCKAKIGFGNRLSSTNGKLYNGKNSGIGGAINSSGTLALLGVIVSDNTAKSSYAGGAVGVTAGSVQLTSCKFMNNSAGGTGGAVYLDSGVTAQISGCTFGNNKASQDGGAIYAYGSTVTVATSVFSSNKSNGGYGGAILLKGVGNNTANLTVSDSEFKVNRSNQSGGAICASEKIGTFNVTGTLFYQNMCYNNDGGGAIAHYSNTLNMESCTFTQNWSWSYGGAVYAKRTVNATDCIFNENDADTAGGALYARYDATLTGCTFQNGGGDANLNWTSSVHYYPIEQNTTLSITESQFSNNTVGKNATVKHGGALYVQGDKETPGNVVLTEVTFKGNKTNGDGGAIYSPGSVGSFEVTDCTFSNNQSAGNGGAIYHASSVLELENSTFTGNSSTAGNGGALFAYRQVNATECTFDSNTAAKAGAAIHTEYTMNLTDCVIKNNQTQKSGALSYVPCAANTKVTITGGEFTGNTATSYGGAICMEGINTTVNDQTVTWDVDLAVTNVTFKSNSAANAGAICAYGKIGEFTVNGCLFESNTAANQGGAIVHYSGSLVLNNSQLIGNTGKNGGAIFATREVKATGCTFDGNTASGNGGALNLAYQSRLDNCTIRNNTAANSAVYIDYENANSGKVTIAGGSITDNVGGGLYLAERTMNITGAPVISRNTAGSAEQNVYLAQSTYLELSSLAEGMYVAITVADASETAKVATVTGSGYKTGMLRSDANNRMLDPDTNGSTLLNLVPRKTASVGTDNYTDMQAAVTAAGTTTTIVVGKEMENTSVELPATSGSEAVKLDLNGNDIGKNVHLSSEGTTTLYLADSNLEYNSEEPTKVLKSAISNKVTVSREHKVDNKRYVVLDAGKYYEVHRVQVSITARTLRPTNNGVGFQVKFSAAESIPDSYLKGFGLIFAVKNGNGEVVTGNYEPKMDLLTDYDQELVNEKTLTIVIKDFLSENIQWAEYTVVGTPFIKLDDGTTVEVEGTPVEVSFRQMVEYANTNFEDLNPVQQKAIARMMYSKETFTTLLSGWNTGNIKAFAQANGFVQK